jgi:acetyltransferase-like isoleucine patch superfamily enzyme
MLKLFKFLLRHYVLRTGNLKSTYIRICKPDSLEFAAFLKRHGGLHSVGRDVAINVGVSITDPGYVRIGNNCSLSACTLLGHDGVVRVLNNAYGKKLDSVGKIDIRDNSFVGHGAIVMPGVTIGPNSIVAAGALIAKDVPAGVVVGGVPGKVICSTEELVKRLEARTESYPWFELIKKRNGSFDQETEPELFRMRVKHFYGE